MNDLPEHAWHRGMDERQLRLIANCITYAENDPAGVPGHNLMILIATMAKLLDGYADIYSRPSATP